MVFRDALPADAQGPVVVVPAVRSLDDPPPGLLAANRSGQWRFSSTANMRHDVALPRFSLWFLVVVALVEAEVVWATATVLSTEDDRIERLADHAHVGDVRSGQRDAEGNAATVGQDVALGAELGAIGRIGPGELPPFGAFTEALSREAHAQSIPTC